MKNKRTFIIILLALIAFSLGAILLINNTDILSGTDKNTVALTKQYLKVIGFLSIMGLVYLRMKNASKIEDEEIE
ncbi:hypothetical protein [Marinifilum sp.]|uniref:hypothetical protein n=1 Tax=Marinifilum sp. TaxID=2033137 RepID=UPI003BAC7679